MEKIKMVDLQGQYLQIKDEIDRAIQDVLTSTAFIQGPQVNAFATALGEYIGSPFVIPCANGTDALQIAMMALGFKPGDEIILPVHTYVATGEVIALLGLTPVFVDVDPGDFNINVDQIEERITAKTVAIVPVHLYGQCADMESILAIANRRGLHVIEDVAQALGAVYRFSNGDVRNAGTMGTIGTTSFFPSKNLGCYGDGGAIFTNDASLAEKIRMISNHGQKVKYHHDVVGVNSRLDTLQAAILQVKLKYLDEYAQKRNEVASFYDEALKHFQFLEVPFRSKNSSHVFHQYTLKIKNGNRDAFKSHLEANGIPTMIYYPVPLHLQKAYMREGFGEGTFVVTEKLSSEVISLPIHTEMELDQLLYIKSVIEKFQPA
ncbi:DegT/DnrJ/EryC1/StrS family aminotransferase [Pseudochryseolinea flava]|uniref:Transcriptional regulator n=1 Tax=Pseudochryseolinea flava TaxID=2059302 RepID=A0A364XZD3_9BACT|nr:DegT/DnrJ/EryC1/StrS family aminotransferase [Pseudochryseolinea flava]RAV99744.1 transcriptional regulator [Pseudochryseolinea flava]